MPGRFIKSEWTSPAGHVFEMQHRYEDRALILDVIKAHQPALSVELGTAKGGFAAMLAETVGAWNGSVITVDMVMEPGTKEKLEASYTNIKVVQDDVLLSLDQRPGATWPFWKNLLARDGTFLYCDNGNKMREIELYAPTMGQRALLGTHDYWTEVKPEWVEPFLANLGFVQHRHHDFAALAHPVDYPASLSRFWAREMIPFRKREA